MSLADLHQPLDGIFAELARWARWPAGGRVLDAGCGSGLKTQLLRAALGQRGTLVGIDRDVTALRSHHAGMQRDFTLAGDLLLLPCANSAFDGVWCSAVVGLLVDPAAALAELRRVLRPDGSALIATGAQCWSALHRWPPAIAPTLALAYQRACADGLLTAPSSDLCSTLAAQLNAAGFARVATRAFLIEMPAQSAHSAELALQPWAAVRPTLAPLLDAATLAAADANAAAPEDVELVSVLLAARARS